MPTISVNGVSHEAGDEEDTIGYEEVVKLAFPQSGPQDVFRVRYTGAIGRGGESTEGRMRAKDRVKVTNGTTFTVTRSSQT